MASMFEHGLVTLGKQPAPPDAHRRPHLGAPHVQQPAPRCGAPDSDESITFEDMLAGVCGAVNAAAAQTALDSESVPADPTMASAQEMKRAAMVQDGCGAIDTTVGTRTAQSSWRDPLIDSVFFSDSDGDGEGAGWQRSRRQAAGADHALACSRSASLRPARCVCISDQQ